MKPYFAIVLMFLVCVPLLMFGAKAITKQSNALSSSGNWLDGWLYRKSHNIIGSSAGDQLNYQVLICVHYSYGADSQGDVYLGQNCRTDFGDVRFTDSSGVNPLDYWIESQISGVQALVWVKVAMIPAGTQTRIYLYYGNQNVSTTSNKDLTFPSASDFEDGTKQGWTISWASYVGSDGVDSTSAYEGNYSRLAGRYYGGNGAAGNGDFFEDISKTAVYLASGSYSIQGAACFVISDNVYFFPRDVKLIVNGYVVNQIPDSGINWQSLSGTFHLNSSGIVTISFEFHLYISSALWTGEERYRIDSVFLRSWCNPEPTHGTWGPVQGSSDTTVPTISNIRVTPTAPYPFVASSTARQGEPVLVTASVTDNGGGVGSVAISYANNITPQGEWTNTTMYYNASTGLWSTIIPGQPGNASVSFFITASNNAGNSTASPIEAFDIQPLPQADLNGDGEVDMWDIGWAASHFMEHYP